MSAKIPSEFLRDVNGDLAGHFRNARLAIEKHGPLDYPTREYLMLAAFAAAGYEESFRIHVARAVQRGLPKAAIQQAILMGFGATTAMLPVVNALRWTEEAFEQQGAAAPNIVRIKSADGAEIGCERFGDRSPLLLVHGATSERSRWKPVMGALEPRYSVYAMDRRGRGASGDARAYAIEREFEDVAAVIDSIGAPVDVIAHSYGAICSLEASRLTKNIRRLVLYEPPIFTQADGPEVLKVREAVIAEIQKHLDAGDPAAALDTFYTKNLQMPAAEIAHLRTLPSWPARLALAHTLPRELRESTRYRFDPAKFTGHAVPTLVVLGGDSIPRYQEGMLWLRASLPGSKLSVLAGQRHGAIDSAPELFAVTALDFLSRN